MTDEWKGRIFGGLCCGAVMFASDAEWLLVMVAGGMACMAGTMLWERIGQR